MRKNVEEVVQTVETDEVEVVKESKIKTVVGKVGNGVKTYGPKVVKGVLLFGAGLIAGKTLLGKKSEVQDYYDCDGEEVNEPENYNDDAVAETEE